MVKDLTEYQAEAIACGYTHDFGFDGKSAPSDIANELRVVDYVSFDNGTDPGDDSTMYLIESTSGLKGYLILSDSFHADPRKSALLMHYSASSMSSVDPHNGPLSRSA